MLTIRLLANPRRASLTSFGLLLSAMTVMACAVIAFYRSSSSVLLIGGLFAVVLAVSAYLWPRAWIVPYRIWNKMSRHYGKFARFYLLGQCYMIITAVGLAGPSSEFAREKGSGSRWITRKPVSGLTGNGRLEGEEPGRVDRSWIRTYALWVIRTGQPWRFALLPFLMLLSILDIEDQSDVPTKTYTLF